jgi:hypothetical protein
MRRMKPILAALALLVCGVAPAEAAEPPNQPVYRSGPWFVVRSVREGGDVVACTGFYRANRQVQLSKDMLIVQTTPLDVTGVAFGFDDQPVGASRPLSAGEQEIKAIAFSGDDFVKLAHSSKVRIEVETPQGTLRHELQLDGLAGALDNIEKGCPVPANAPAAPNRRRLRH